MDARKLSAQLQFRSDRRVLLRLQSASGQHRCFPRGSAERETGVYWPLCRRRQSISHRIPRPRKGAITGGGHSAYSFTTPFVLFTGNKVSLRLSYSEFRTQMEDNYAL